MAPDEEEYFNLELEIYAVDPDMNYVKTTLLIEVYPNHHCEIMLDEAYRIMNCTENQFCSFTILWDHVKDEDDDLLYFHSNIPLNHVWLKFSSLNKTLFGIPNIV